MTHSRAIECTDLLIKNPNFESLQSIIYEQDWKNYDHSEWSGKDTLRISLIDFDIRMGPERKKWHPNLQKHVIDFMLKENIETLYIIFSKAFYSSPDIARSSLERLDKKTVEKDPDKLAYFVLKCEGLYFGTNGKFNQPFIGESNIRKFKDKEKADETASYFSNLLTNTNNIEIIPVAMK